MEGSRTYSCADLQIGPCVEPDIVLAKGRFLANAQSTADGGVNAKARNRVLARPRSQACACHPPENLPFAALACVE